MRVLLVNQYLDLPGEGGTGRHWALIEQFSKMGVEVLVVRAARARASGGGESLGGVDVVEIPVLPAKSAALRMLQMKLFQFFVEWKSRTWGKFDLVIGSSVHLHAALGALSVARRQGCPFVFEARDLWPEVFWDELGWSRKHFLYKYFKKIELNLLESADLVISAIPGIDRYLFEQGFSQKPYYFLPNAVDLAKFEPFEDAGTGDYFTLWGSHGRMDALELLIPVAQILALRAPRVRIRIIGHGPLRGRMEKRASVAKINNIDFVDPVPRERLRDFASDSFALGIVHKHNDTVKRFGTGANKINEYLSLCRPCLGVWEVYQDPVVLSGGGVSITSSDPEEIATAIAGLWEIRGTESASRMAKNGRTWVLRYRNRSVLSELACIRICQAAEKGKS